MENHVFNQIIEEQVERCTSVLMKKQQEYATADRLHNFNVSAEMQGLKPRQALAGMMAKHVISIYDMCWDENTFDLDIWNEKITDNINYLLLLRAVVEDEQEGKEYVELHADNEVFRVETGRKKYKMPDPQE